MAGVDDAMQDPLFKNVPRRPRSAASWPRMEEPDGGDDPGGIISVSNNASALASNKQPSSTGGGAEHVPVPRAKKHRLVPIEQPELEPEPEPEESSSSSEVEPAVDWAENERCRKGKTPVVNEDDACTAVARRHPGSGLGKLMGDAIRSHGSTAVAAGFVKPSRTTKAKKPGTKPKKKPAKKDRTRPNKDSSAWFWCGMGRGRMSSAGSDVDYSFDRIGVVSDRLRTTLRGLGVAAAAPVRVYGRLLSGSDRDVQDARLLMSCKRWRAVDAEFPPCAFLTEGEREEAHGEGLALTAYDRGGDGYGMTFRFLQCNVACRLISKWSEFLRRNGLAVGKDEPPPVDDDVMLDLWLFRRPGGKVGMVMLHYRRGDAAHADAALDEVERKRRLQLNNADARAGGNGNNDGDDDAVMEDVVGDANEADEAGGGAPGEVAAASSSPSEPADGGVGAKAAEEQAGAVMGVVPDAPSTSSPQLHRGAGRSDEVTTPLSLGLGGGGVEEEQEAGGALMVMVVEVEGATQSSLDPNAGGAANEVAAPPSSPEAGGGVAMMATEEDEAAAELAEAAARSWNVTECEFQAAQGLVMLSKANSDS